ncbi:uncharacterized protein LOC5519512 isoform X2 [Nematostella vectensis]|nr:uncharacterized protein LOC5519512 isoform X2 [Nematostella vectensis]XP_032220176.1 uncharacterized protein LOC5519512 isoform X2 [Nematostella vectensis]
MVTRSASHHITMATFSLLLVLVVLPAAIPTSVSVDEVTSCPVDKYINGCSVPGDLPFFYKKTFTPACRMHDVCYRCFNVYDWKKDSCDAVFKANMYSLCKEKYGPSSVFRVRICRRAADGYHLAVAKLGGSHWDKYKDSKFAWCNMPCAVKIGDPANTLNP